VGDAARSELEQARKMLRGTGLHNLVQDAGGVLQAPPPSSGMTVRCRCGWEFTGPTDEAIAARAGHFGSPKLRPFEPRNQHSGRPWTTNMKTAVGRFHRFAKTSDQATSAEIAEVIGVPVQIQGVVRQVAPWATYVTRGGKVVNGRGGDRSGVWTWRTGCLRPPVSADQPADP
jgi:hypothetical protein